MPCHDSNQEFLIFYEICFHNFSRIQTHNFYERSPTSTVGTDHQHSTSHLLVSSIQVSIGSPEPIPHASERDCKKDPIPPRDTRLIAWEIKRPQIQNLQPVPSNLRKAIDDGTNKEAMHKAVQFCVNAVKQALEEASLNGTTAGGWLGHALALPLDYWCGLGDSI